jgi:hypothetical protein
MSEQLDDDETLESLCAEFRARFEKAEALLRDCAVTLAFGIEGRIDKNAAYDDAFAKLYGSCFGPDAAIQILAEGKRV